MAGQDLVRMVIEGDDRRPSIAAAARGRARRAGTRVRDAARRTRRRRRTAGRAIDRALIPWTSVMATSPGIVASAGASSSARCGRLRAGPCPRSARRDPTGAAARPRAPPATHRRADEATLERVGDLVDGQRDGRQCIEPGVRWQEQLANTVGALRRGRRTDRVERARPVQRERTARASGAAHPGRRRCRAACPGREPGRGRRCPPSNGRRRSRSAAPGRCRPIRSGRARGISTLRDGRSTASPARAIA